jgi:hypothetical protein
LGNVSQKRTTVSKIVLGILSGFALGAAITWTLRIHSSDEEQEAQSKEGAAETRVLHTNGQTWIKLDKAAQQRAGLTLAELKEASLEPEIKGYGRVMDPAPLAALLADAATTRAASEASARDFQRLKVLHAQDQNVSTRALEAAEAAMKRDQIAADAVQLRMLASWGNAIVNQPDLPGFVRSLAALETALVRIDLPLGQVLFKSPTGGRIAALTAPEQPIAAQFLGSVTAADPQTQGQGFLFLLREHAPLPGASVVGWITLPGQSQTGAIIPRSSLVRHEGGVFVYRQVADEFFARQEVVLEHPVENGWFVNEGLEPKSRIVVTGAQQLLSEELKAQWGQEE